MNIFAIQDGDPCDEGMPWSVPGTDITVELVELVERGYRVYGVVAVRNGEVLEDLADRVRGTPMNAASMHELGRYLQAKYRVEGRSWLDRVLADEMGGLFSGPERGGIGGRGGKAAIDRLLEDEAVC